MTITLTIKINKFISQIVLLILLSINILAQNNKNSFFSDNCIYEKNEKVFVHLQKSIFISGEPLNYKGYIVNASTLQPVSPSKILYFDIININNKQIITWRANIIDNMVTGSILLPDTISAGIYKLRAYTNWMRNTSPDLYFSTQILITKITDKELNDLKICSQLNISDNNIQFYPEGGFLIDGIKSKVVFTINTKYEDLTTIQGYIKDEDGNIIENIDTKYSNLGTFTVNPVYGKTYLAEFILPTGEVISSNLPEIKKIGYTIQIEDSQNSEIIINIRTNADEILNFKSLRLIISAHGFITTDTKVNINNGIGQISVQKKNLLKGIHEIVLFDPFNKPVSTRIYYITPDKLHVLKIKTNKKTYSKREKVKLEIELGHLPFDETGNLSISVSEQSPLPNLFNNNNILSYLYRNSELTHINHGHLLNDSISIQYINDFFITIEPEYYAWSYMSAQNQNLCNYITEDKGFVLTGKIIYKSTGLPVIKGLVTLAISDTISALDYNFTDSTGSFHFLLDKSHDNKNLILQLANKDEYQNDIKWIIDEKDGHENNFKITPVVIKDDAQQYLSYCRKIRLVNSIFKSKQINNIDTLKIISSEANNNNNFFGVPDYIIYPSDFIELPDFQEITENILPGVRFRKKKNVYFLQLYDGDNEILWDEHGSLLLNGVPFNNLEYIANLGSKDIKKIEVVKSKVFYGDLTFYGIVSIYTYDGKIPESYLDNNSFSFNNIVQESIDYKDEFPQYNLNNKFTNLPDMRQSLYWNPDIQISVENKLYIEFFTSDLEAVYDIKIQGITQNGMPIEASTVIEVIK